MSQAPIAGFLRWVFDPRTSVPCLRLYRGKAKALRASRLATPAGSRSDVAYVSHSHCCAAPTGRDYPTQGCAGPRLASTASSVGARNCLPPPALYTTPAVLSLASLGFVVVHCP